MQIALSCLVLGPADAHLELLLAELDMSGVQLQCTFAQDAETAGRALRPAPDCVLVCGPLAGMDGSATYRLVRAAEPDVPVLVVAGALADDELNGLLAAGARELQPPGERRIVGTLTREIAMAGARRDVRRLLALQQVVVEQLAGDPEPGRLLPTVLALVGRGLGMAAGAVWRPGADGRLGCTSVWLRGDGRLAGAIDARRHHRPGPGEGLPGQVWQQRTTLVAGEASALLGLRHAFAVPMQLGQQFEGVLELITDRERLPNPDVLDTLSHIGAQLAQYLDRWRTRDILRRQDRALAAAVNGVVLADATQPGFPLVYVNPGFERLTGYSADEVLGRSCALLQGEATEPAVVAELAAALAAGREHRTTLRNYRKDGSAFWNEILLSPVHDQQGRVVEYSGVQTDVTARREAEDRVGHLANHDQLTGLANWSLMAKHLDRAIARADHHGLQLALLSIDLDGFRKLNNDLGRDGGDQLLCDVGERLGRVTRATDVLAHDGGDEFVLLLADQSGDARRVAERVAESIAAALAEPFTTGGTPVRVHASVGISLYPHDADDAEGLRRNADAAMHRAKGAGGRTHRVFRAGSRRPAPLPDPPLETEDHAELARILEQRAVTAVYQPVVDLDSGRVVAYEALARGPEGSRLERPDLLFAAARAAGVVAQLDWLCRGAAVTGALAAGLAASTRLYLNVEPAALGTPCPEWLAPVWNRATTQLSAVVEITERALTSRPASLLATIGEVRGLGWGVALDDVGADIRSLALMPLLRPDVIKLDLRLVQEQPTAEIAEIVNAVNAQRERTGCVVLAEGIETAAHLQAALAMGATLGQGWYFGRPGPLPAAGPTGPSVALAAAPRAVAPAGRTPYEVVGATALVRRADKRLLLAISRYLEQQSVALGDSGVALSAFQSADRFTPATYRRYSAMAVDAAFVAALGVGMAPEPAPGVRGAALAPDDPLLGEWSVVVVGSHFAGALVAIDLGDTGPDADRRFDYALTYDRDLVLAAARTLMQRVVPVSEVDRSLQAIDA